MGTAVVAGTGMGTMEMGTAAAMAMVTTAMGTGTVAGMGVGTAMVEKANSDVGIRLGRG
jgi:hypothetical protein